MARFCRREVVSFVEVPGGAGWADGGHPHGTGHRQEAVGE